MGCCLCRGNRSLDLWKQANHYKYAIHGNVKDSITITCQNGPGDISFTKEGDLIFSDSYRKTVNIVKHQNSETLIYAPDYWTPLRLCCTRSGDILAHMMSFPLTEYIHKIVRYQGESLKQEIDNDEYENHIFKTGFGLLYMSENNNGDICVSDTSANIVIVLDKAGRVRLRYDGRPARRMTYFVPEVSLQMP